MSFSPPSFLFLSAPYILMSKQLPAQTKDKIKLNPRQKEERLKVKTDTFEGLVPQAYRQTADSSFHTLIFLPLPNSCSFKLFLGRSHAPQGQYKVMPAITPLHYCRISLLLSYFKTPHHYYAISFSSFVIVQFSFGILQEWEKSFLQDIEHCG